MMLDQSRALRRVLAAALCSASLLTATVLHAVDEATAAKPPVPAEMAALADKSILLDVAAAGDAWVAVGARGHILRSTDGKTWTQQPSPVNTMLTAVQFVDAKLGWIVGHDAVVLHSQDGGASWALQYRDPQDQQLLLFDLHFRNAQEGMAIGAYGLLMVTSDGGASWETLSNDLTGEEVHFSRLLALPNGRLLLVGEIGMLAFTDDFGQNWQRLESPYSGSFFGADLLGDNSVVIYGMRGNVYRTDALRADLPADAWQKLDTGSKNSLFGSARLPDGSLVLVGMNNSMLKLAPAASSTTVMPNDLAGILDDALAAQDRLIIVGERGVRQLPLPVAE